MRFYVHVTVKNFHNDQDNNNSNVFDVSHEADIYILMQWIQFMKCASKSVFVYLKHGRHIPTFVFCVNTVLDMDLSTC